MKTEAYVADVVRAVEVEASLQLMIDGLLAEAREAEATGAYNRAMRYELAAYKLIDAAAATADLLEGNVLDGEI